MSVLIVGGKIYLKRFSGGGLPIFFPPNQGGKATDRTSEEFTEVQRVHDVLSKAMDQEIWKIAELMVGKRDDQLFGKTEFELRDKVLRMGAKALEATVDDCKKRGTKAAAPSAQTAAKTRDLSLGGHESS